MPGYLFGTPGADVAPPTPAVPTLRAGIVYEPWMARSKNTMQTTWIDPNGEGGIHRPYGGKHRDWPLNFAAVNAEPVAAQFDQDVVDMRLMNVDYFWADITNPRLTDGAGNYQRIIKLITAVKAAQDRGENAFIIPWLDINGGAFNGIPGEGTSTAMTPEAVADRIKIDFFDQGVNFMDGTYWLASYKAEGDSTGKIAGLTAVTYWNRVLDRLTVLGYDRANIKFQATVLHQTTTNFTSLATVSAHLGIWGPARPGTNVSNLATWANLAHSLNRDWDGPVRWEDERPYSSTYAEPEGSLLLQQMYARLDTDAAKHAILITFNDYAEGTQRTPSANFGSIKQWVDNYFLTKWKTGVAPTIDKDRVIIIYRVQNTGAAPSLSGITTVACTLDGGGTTPYNKVEALCFLTGARTININGGGAVAVPAGVSRTVGNLVLDQAQQAVLKNGATTVVTAVSTTRTANPQTPAGIAHPSSTPYVPDYANRLAWVIAA